MVFFTYVSFEEWFDNHLYDAGPFLNNARDNDSQSTIRRVNTYTSSDNTRIVHIRCVARDDPLDTFSSLKNK